MQDMMGTPLVGVLLVILLVLGAAARKYVFFSDHGPAVFKPW